MVQATGKLALMRERVSGDGFRHNGGTRLAFAVPVITCTLAQFT